MVLHKNAVTLKEKAKMKNFLIKLLGGKTQQEFLDEIESFRKHRHQHYIGCHQLDFASTLLKRWNEYREAINALSKEVLKHNSQFFTENSSLFFDIVLQDYYFRRLFLLQNKSDFFGDAEEKETSFYNREYGVLGKVFWEIEPSFMKLIHSDNFIKDWNKI